ncbi:unnamed protein product [Rhizophagus irregularis]|nr:unnamed protein product [Rhizophagus irregularis]
MLIGPESHYRQNLSFTDVQYYGGKLTLEEYDISLIFKQTALLGTGFQSVTLFNNEFICHINTIEKLNFQLSCWNWK